MVKTEREEFGIPGGPEEPAPATKGHPRGLYLLYFTEMWERFSYYGMRAIFTLYMVNALLFDKAFASKIYGSYTGLVYLTPLLGGFVADRYWGNRRSIIFGGVLMAMGQFFMFLSGGIYYQPDTATLLMYVGLGLLIFGNGFFKPNISTMVGQLYPEGDRRVDSAFTIFYQGINLGALLAPAICGNLGEQYTESGAVIPSAFRWGFLAACIGMLISLASFVWLKNKFLVTPAGENIGMPPRHYRAPEPEAERPKAKINKKKVIAGVVSFLVLFVGFFLFFMSSPDSEIIDSTIGAIIFSSVIVLPVMIITEGSLSKVEKHRILAVYIIAFFVIFFWAAFEQAGASLTFFAQEQTNRNILGWNMPASLFQIFNAMFIVLLAPAAVALWSFLGRNKIEPSSPVKQSIGLALLALGYLYIAWGVNDVQPWVKVSMVWLIGLYLIHTIGELFLSPIGLSMVVKLAPVRFVSLLMGVWFMSTATANYFAGMLSALYPEEVKIETVAEGRPPALEALKALPLDTAIWQRSAADSVLVPVAIADTSQSIAAWKGFEGRVKSFIHNNLTELEPEREVAINNINLQDAQQKVSMYHLKLMSLKGDIKNVAATPDGKKLYSYKRVEKKTLQGPKVVESIEVWNLDPKKKSFLGMPVVNLRDFFMIFVYMAGAAAILLFAIHRFLLKLMHGKY